MDPHKAIKIAQVLLAVCCMSAFIVTPPGLATEYVNETITDMGDPVYWLDRGALYATYGSYTEAIKAFDKALELDADNDKAYYNKSLSHTEIGNLNQALLDINKAIAINMGNGNYYYARGRVQLLSGNKEQALKDFAKASKMGDRDAKEYLAKMQ
jgi:tetratricopeptide (TPR) repeat protein